MRLLPIVDFANAPHSAGVFLQSRSEPFHHANATTISSSSSSRTVRCFPFVVAGLMFSDTDRATYTSIIVLRETQASDSNMLEFSFASGTLFVSLCRA